MIASFLLILTGDSWDLFYTGGWGINSIDASGDRVLIRAIAIRGLVEGAIVKITTPGGRLICQTNALGGQAVWDGHDYKGRKITTGVYLVLVSDDTRRKKTAGKIIFIGK